MSITKYEENGKSYYKVYVHIRSNVYRGQRFQKAIKGILTLTEAKKEEKKLIRILSMKAERFDGAGLLWSDIIHLWWKEVEAGYLGEITKRSCNEYYSIVNKWTRPWSKKQASEINRHDARNLIKRMEEKALSNAYQKKVKNIINKVYEWGLDFGYITGVKHSPCKGMIIEKGEEKVPDILSLEEIKRFLTAAMATKNP